MGKQLTRGVNTFIILLEISLSALAQAPVRAEQPYAEAAACAKSGVILCEDFNYPNNFPCSSDIGKWINPGLKVAYNYTCAGRSIVPVSDYPNQPAGSPTGGYVKRSDVAIGAGAIAGCLWSDCERTTSDNPVGATYTNGNPLTNDTYVRFQVFFSDSPAYKWPSFDNKIFFFWPDKYVDKPSASIDAGFYLSNNLFCSNVNMKFNDALSFRVGDNSCQFKGYPAENTGTCHPEHQEYCSGQGLGTPSPGVSTTTPPDDTPYPGRVFRFRRGKWYTFEYRYKLSSPGVQNGTIEAWINGVKIYSNSDLATCGVGDGSCAAVAELVQYFWYNAFQESSGVQGYGLVDNLIISKNYIGPPGGILDTTPPVPPSNLSITSQNAKLQFDEMRRPFVDIKINPLIGNTYHLFKNGSYYSRIPGASYRDVWVNVFEPQNYEIWAYRKGKPVGVQRFNVATVERPARTVTPLQKIKL